MSQPNYNHPSNQNQYSGATRNLIDAASKEIHSKTPNTISVASGSGVASSRRVTNPYDKTTCVRFTPNSEFATPAAALKQVSSFCPSSPQILCPTLFTCSITNPPPLPAFHSFTQTKAREGTGYKAQAHPQAARINQVRYFIQNITNYENL